jgi:hypothetical protein
VIATLGCVAATTGSAVETPDSPPAEQRADRACRVARIERTDTGGIVVPSPDGEIVLLNKEDERKVAQIYSRRRGSEDLTCLTCTQVPGGPRGDRYKLQPAWHPSGRWFFIGVERDSYSKPPVLGLLRGYVEGQLRNGLWTDMWAVSADGARWRRLTEFKSGVKGTADGFIGPAFTPDGRRGVWSQIVDGNVFQYSFGRWELILADLVERDGMPDFVARRDITPAGMHWNEPGNFHPDGRTLLLSGSTEKDAQGMDQYLLDVDSGRLRNLTNSPKVWDEHGRLSPDGEKIIFMSAHPYRADPKTSTIWAISTEFMLMDSDGRNLQQLTHLRVPGYPESGTGAIAAAPLWHADGRGAALRTLKFPDYIDFEMYFEGACGARR